MRFQVPQFIDYELKIIGPFTFRQFTFIAIAGAVCFILFYTVSFAKFLLATIVIMGIALTLAFVKIGGRPLPTFLINFFNFSLSPRIYLWKKKEIAPKFTVIKKSKEIEKKEEEKDVLPLKIAEGSRLKNLATQIETQKR